MKKMKYIALVAVPVILVVAGLALWTGQKQAKAKAEAKASEEKLLTFGGYTDCEVFAQVPTLQGEQVTFDEAEEVGDGDYLIRAYDTTFGEYVAYLADLEAAGYTKYVDNGEEGFEGFLYSTQYQKDGGVVVVSHFTNLDETHITVNEEETLSPRLIYDDAYEAGGTGEDSLHMVELYNGGSSFVFQLKSGNFVINDGGVATELPYLLDYLESLVPEGEIPVIEAWIFTHSHSDHAAALQALSENEAYLNRIYVESVYYCEPGDEAFKLRGESESSNNRYIKVAGAFLKSTDGNGPEIYRMRTGDRLYFGDITMDVVYTQELLKPEEWDTWNSSSTMLMYHIEGQKVFMTADSDWDCQLLLTRIFDRSYFDLDVYSAPHHGKNIFLEFINHCERIGTVLYPSPGSAEIGNDLSNGNNVLAKRVQNEYLRLVSEEYLSFEDGTKVLTFPYETGSYESLSLTQWVYHSEPPKRQQTSD